MYTYVFSIYKFFEFFKASSVKPASFGNSNANISKPVLNQQNKCVSKHSDIFNDPNRFKTKPAISYATLVALALKNSKNGCLTVSNFPFFRTANSGWKNSVRHNLSFSKYFMKIETRRGDGDSRRSYIWTVNPARSHELEQSLSKLMERDRENTLKSLANPGECSIIYSICGMFMILFLKCFKRLRLQMTLMPFEQEL
uniref:Fork-head domain-containing protein n=1 Tax=Syphacia muris TaxID=451379 RepID=A0A0N5ATU9_9BILA